MKIAVIPIDNRPVCSDLICDIVSVDKGSEIYLPPKEFLGSLNKPSNFKGILDWLKTLNNIDYLVVALDTVAYGGLIPSRRIEYSYKKIKKQILNFINIVKEKNFGKVYAFSSIMRISNNNINEEEKKYWSNFGCKIFNYSLIYHQYLVCPKNKNNAQLKKARKHIPSKILKDYLNTRKRNFKVNLLYLDFLKSGVFNYIIFSLDDCHKYGLNVYESSLLQKSIDKNNLNDKAFIKTGADEIPLVLTSKCFVDYTCNNKVKIYPYYLYKNSINKISKYENISVKESCEQQIILSGALVSSRDDCDIIMVVNNFKNEQGELVMDVYEPSSKYSLEEFNKPFFVVDILNANGADNEFVKINLEKFISDKNFYGFSAWNTTSNSLGSAICLALIKFLSKNYNENAFKKLQIIRLLDDWIYQSFLRKELKQKYKTVNNCSLQKHILEYENILKEKFQFNCQSIEYSFPWNRFFEIRIKIN